MLYFYSASVLIVHDTASQSTLGAPEDGIMTAELLERLYMARPNVAISPKVCLRCLMLKYFTIVLIYSRDYVGRVLT